MECSICLEIYKYPQILNCGHSYCLPCTVFILDKKQCPECRSDIQNIITNYSLINVLEYLDCKDNIENKKFYINKINQMISQFQSIQSPVIQAPLRQASDIQASDIHTSDRHVSDRLASNRPASDIHTSDRPASDRLASDRLASNRPASDRPASDRSASDRHTSDAHASDRLPSDVLASDRLLFLDKFEICILLEKNNITYKHKLNRAALAKKIQNINLPSNEELIEIKKDFIKNNNILTEKILNMMDYSLKKKCIKKFNIPIVEKNNEYFNSLLLYHEYDYNTLY